MVVRLFTASVYEEVFQLVSFEEIAKSTLHMPHGPRSTAYCRVPARFTYNGLEGFDVNMFWSVAIMIHTLGTSGVREWDTQVRHPCCGVVPLSRCFAHCHAHFCL